MEIKNCLASLFLSILVFTSTQAFADWGAPMVVIDQLYVYPTYVVVIQTPYAGTAGCQSSGWSFNWSDFDAPTQQRIYSTLLAARLAKTPIKPIFSDTGCGPENFKKFTGYLVI